MEKNVPPDAYEDVSVSRIDTHYAHLRLIHPQVDVSMAESLRRYGQLSPVVVGRGHGGRYELVDGFKRFRVCQQLGMESLKAKVLDAAAHVLKAAMVSLNGSVRSGKDLEEALIVHSLGHEDGLTQGEIAVLLCRHKSWVCRRMSIIERLCDEALSQIKLGLVNISIGRELARLPHGNQQAAIATILKYRLNYRETARLVSALLEHPRWDHESILRFPEEILSERSPDRPRNNGLSRPGVLFHERVMAIEQRCVSLVKELSISRITQEDWRQISYVVGKIIESLTPLKNVGATQVREGSSLTVTSDHKK